MADLRLDHDQLLELADLVAAAIVARAEPSGAGLVDAAAVAARYGVARDFVYRHADDLGAVRLGEGPRARLRFDLERVGERLSVCPAGRGSEGPSGRVVEPIRHRRRRPGSGTGADLLPVRGVAP